MNDLILVDMIAAATPYANPALVGQIDDADNYAAIAAASGQLSNLFYSANILVMNNNQGIVSATTKGNDGQYINPANVLNEITGGGNLRMIKHPAVGFNKFFLGDGNVYHVDLRGDVIVRIGYNLDDADRNQYSLYVEQFFFSYIETSKRPGLVYGDFATIKAAIEKP
jgi:glycosyltransferase involved in cell wall biosynthesis